MPDLQTAELFLKDIAKLKETIANLETMILEQRRTIREKKNRIDELESSIRSHLFCPDVYPLKPLH